MLSKKDLYSFSILLFAIFFSFSIIFLFENPISHVLALWLTAISAIFITKFEVTHPLVWFSSSFVLYSTGYAILYILGYLNSGYNKENIFLPLVALTVVVLVVGVKKYGSPRFHEKKNYHLLGNRNNKKLIEFILLVLIIILSLCVAVLFITPFESKTDLLRNKNMFFIIGVYSTRFISFFCCFYMLLFIDIDKKKTKLFIFLSATLIVLLSLFTGERDAMFRFFVILIMTLFILGKISKKTIISLIPIGAIYLIASRYFKYYFVSGELKATIKEESFIYSFLSADFLAAGENLQILLNNNWTESLHGFSLIAYDIISPFLPGGLFMNVGAWFNDTFYPNSYSRAFTLVGQGYVAGGVVGIIAVFFILGIGIKFLYSKATENIYWLVIYIYSIPTIISAFRSTLGTVFTGLTRIALFSIVIHAFLFLLINNRNRVKSKKLN
ncbi:MAG: O-antigen polymerase [Bacillota bacterium]